MPGPDREARIIELTNAANQLMEQIAEFNEEAGDQFVVIAKRATFNRRLFLGLIISVAIDLILSVAMIFAFAGVDSNNNKITAVTHRLDLAQTTQRQNALCPLYQVFLDGKSKAARDAALDKAKYDHAYVVIQGGYDALKCKEFETHPTHLG